MAYGIVYAIGIDQTWVENALHQWDIRNRKPHFIPLEQLIENDDQQYRHMIKINEEYLQKLANQPITNKLNQRKNQVMVNLRALKKHLQLSDQDRFKIIAKNVPQNLIPKNNSGYLSDKNYWGKFDFYTNIIDNAVEPFDKIEFIDHQGHINKRAIQLHDFAPKQNPLPDAILLPDGLWHENLTEASYYHAIKDATLVYPDCFIYAYGYHV